MNQEEYIQIYKEFLNALEKRHKGLISADQIGRFSRRLYSAEKELANEEDYYTSIMAVLS